MASQSPNERRDRTRNEIKKLIEERTTVLSQYYHLAKHSDIEDDDISSVLEQIEEFCQELIDYIAAGQFELYRRIEEGNERRGEIIQLAEKIMPRINDTTQVAIAFNDRYDKPSALDDKAIKLLPKYLDKLGEELATRIELEDQLINTLLTTKSKPELVSVSV